jgi:hypothetical protein
MEIDFSNIVSDNKLYDEDYPLTGYDIMSIIGYPVGIVKESDITSTDIVHGKMHNNALIVLINDQEEIRHWTCVVKDNESFCYFDSFGERPQNEVLTRVIDRYMNNSLQHDNASTCGRWVGHFIRFYGINEDAYAALFKKLSKKCSKRSSRSGADRYITLVTGDLARFNILRTPNDDPSLIGNWVARE